MTHHHHRYSVCRPRKTLLRLISAAGVVLTFCCCSPKKTNDTTPFGTPVDDPIGEVVADGRFSLDDIKNNGELIMLTLSGPETYYDYRGRGMGLQYLLCQKFTQQLGVSLRVEVCKDTAELVRRLTDGEGDIIAYPLSRHIDGLRSCGATTDSLQTQWAVSADNSELAQKLDDWFRPELIAEVRQEENFAFSAQSVTRRVYSPMLDRKGGIISHYDHFFKRYAPQARWDWRLMAAQCYQESTFDPNARSWAGACGLMQIMPSTAAHLGLPQSQIFDAEKNIAAAAKYISELTTHFTDVPGTQERTLFVLAAYNGGFFHIRDAMALAAKHGRNPHRWADVSPYVLKLREPAYYNDPVVKHGFMRGDETVDYVQKIRQRWNQYRGVAKGSVSDTAPDMEPKKAKKAHRFTL